MRVGDGEGFQRRLGQASCLGGLAPVAGVGEKPGCARRVVDDRDFEERVSRALAAEQLLGEEGDLVDAVHLLYSVVVTTGPSAAEAHQAERRRRPRGAVRDGLIAAGIELARTGGPDAVVLRGATRMVGVVPNAAYRHFADRDELLAAVCAAAMRELAARMAAGVAAVLGQYGDPAAALRRLDAIGAAYLAFAREEPGLFATAFAVPQQHGYDTAEGGTGPERTPLGHLRAALDELVDAGVLDRRRRDGIEFPIWSAVHGLAVLAGSEPLRDTPDATRRHLEELTFAFIGEGLA